MPKAVCLKCNQNIEFDYSMLNQEVNCPSCDNITKLVDLADADKIENINQVDASLIAIPIRLNELLNENENVLYSSRPSKSALIIKMILSGIMAFVFSGGLIFELGIYGLLIFFFILAILLTVTYYKWKNTYYVITNTRTLVSQGVFNIVIKVIKNKNVQIISINTGIIDRWLKLNSIQISTAGQGGGSAGILSFIPGLSTGSVTLQQVITRDILKHYC